MDNTFIFRKVLKSYLNLIIKPYFAFKIWILDELIDFNAKDDKSHFFNVKLN